ncbi:extracellular solute-binding protein [Demetria terragena]|uniref:extracellular solute-binding protein n=1 Tax=Demetria terragena TaxID=63959 RepID=UPI00035DE938|nr:extracellular solute-binding protein [Demetria terragena]
MSEVRIDYVSKRARQDLGMSVKILSGGADSLTARVTAERHNPQADVVLGLGEPLLNRLATDGAFEPFRPNWYGELPAAAQAGTNHVLFTQTPVVLTFNAGRLDGAGPTDWVDLANPRWANKFFYPRGQTAQTASVGILWRYTDPATGQVSPEGWDVLGRILRNSLAIPDGQRFDWRRVASGEVPVVADWLGGIQVGEQDADVDVELVRPSDGTPYVQTGIGITTGTPLGDQARTFVDWFGSADFQAEYVKETKSDTPLNTRALAKLPDEAKAVRDIPRQTIDWTTITPHLTRWLQRIELELS